MNEPVVPPSRPEAPPRGNGPTALLTALLAAQLGLAWIHGRMLNRQHAQLLDIREDLQGLAEAIEASYGEAPQEEGSLAPAALERHRRPARRHARGPRLAAYRNQEPQDQESSGKEQDRAAKELEASRASQEKAVRDAKVAQKQISFREAAERAERVEKIDNASKGFMWATLGTAVVLFAAFAARGFIRKQRG